jgi:hypothetical protein
MSLSGDSQTSHITRLLAIFALLFVTGAWAKADEGWCGSEATWDSADLAIGVEPARTNGLHDLRVTANLLRWSPEKPDKKRTAHVIFRYNGKRYEPVGKIPWWLENRNLPPGE